jgi:hypothetical protein
MTDHQPRHVFISYVRENQKQVDRRCHELESHGVNVWLDRHDIKRGARWKIAITSDQMVSIQTIAVKRNPFVVIRRMSIYAKSRLWVST